MSVFICEKCGRIDNSANSNNFWQAFGNKSKLKRGEPIIPKYDNEFFDTHPCCALCCKGIKYKDGSPTRFTGDSYECVTEKTWKEFDEVTQKQCANYEDFIEGENDGN